MAFTDGPDPYLDPLTGVFHNKVGARTPEALRAAEGDLSFARMLELLDDPPPHTTDLAELRAIHRHLFQDVYDWAGELRTVDLRKTADPFLPVPMIERAAHHAFEELRAEKYLRGLPRHRFIGRLAHHYDQLNYIHPFREGNGRAQRYFWSRVAREAGWELDWRPVEGPVNDEACRIAAEKQDLGPLRAMFGEVVVGPVTPSAE